MARSGDICRRTAATAKRCWRSFAKAGIDIDALADRLQDEGAKSLRQILERSDVPNRTQEPAPESRLSATAPRASTVSVAHFSRKDDR